jgi:hypothetical protein
VLKLGVRSFRKRIVSGAVVGFRKTPPLVGNATILVVRGNISLTVNIVLNERVTEFSPVVSKQ